MAADGSREVRNKGLCLDEQENNTGSEKNHKTDKQDNAKHEKENEEEIKIPISSCRSGGTGRHTVLRCHGSFKQIHRHYRQWR